MHAMDAGAVGPLLVRLLVYRAQQVFHLRAGSPPASKLGAVSVALPSILEAAAAAGWPWCEVNNPKWRCFLWYSAFVVDIRQCITPGE